MHDHSLPEAEALLSSDCNVGLSHKAVEERLARDGANVLLIAKAIPWWKRLAEQFQNLMIGLLVAAAVLAGILGDWFDSAAILAIVVMNAILGFVQEQRAERAMGALKRLSAPQAKVRREGSIALIPAEQLVVGDIILLESGDRSPADARIVAEFGLQTLESSLTGESTAISKRADIVLPTGTPLADRANCVFAGTIVAAGKATAIVFATGMNTEIGAIARLMQQTHEEETPLQRRLAELSRTLVKVCLALVAVIFLLQWLRGGNLSEVLLTSVSLAVAAIPEGLPAVVTVSLAIGMQRMAKRSALIRTLPSVETLGCVTVICTDKTGTLTQNKMTVRNLWVFDRSWQVDGEGYSPEGSIRPLNASNDSSAVDENRDTLARLLLYADRCNNSQWSAEDAVETTATMGDPTEIALKVVAAKADNTLSSRTLDGMLHENPFDSDRKRMSQVYRDESGALLLIVKGAPEQVLAVSSNYLQDSGVMPILDVQRKTILERNSQLASMALRVLAVAFRPVSDELSDWQSEANLTFVGLIGMLDPPRREAKEAVQRCRDAGIRPVMITGDHPETAIAIATEVGIAESGAKVMIGSTIESRTEQELALQIQDYSVFARVTAEHKLRVVNALKSQGQVVAMTGDGVNDAPAVKVADIGVVMGITGTDVTKEAADMVLTDDNFVSIVNAVEEGRGVYENIRKFLQFLLACNSSEVIFMFAASLLGWPSPLLAIQILWINLVTDGIPALALASEPLGKDLMKRPPRPVDEPILNWASGLAMLMHGLLMASVTLIGFAWSYQGQQKNLEEARAVAFCILTLSQIFYSMACRDFVRIMPSVGLFSNPFLVYAVLGSVAIQLAAIACPWSAEILGLSAMPWSDLPMILLLSLLPVTVVEIKKMVMPNGGNH